MDLFGGTIYVCMACGGMQKIDKEGNVVPRDVENLQRVVAKVGAATVDRPDRDYGKFEDEADSDLDELPDVLKYVPAEEELIESPTVPEPPVVLPDIDECGTDSDSVQASETELLPSIQDVPASEPASPTAAPEGVEVPGDGNVPNPIAKAAPSTDSPVMVTGLRCQYCDQPVGAGEYYRNALGVYHKRSDRCDPEKKRLATWTENVEAWTNTEPVGAVQSAAEALPTHNPVPAAPATPADNHLRHIDGLADRALESHWSLAVYDITENGQTLGQIFHQRAGDHWSARRQGETGDTWPFPAQESALRWLAGADLSPDDAQLLVGVLIQSAERLRGYNRAWCEQDESEYLEGLFDEVKRLTNILEHLPENMRQCFIPPPLPPE